MTDTIRELILRVLDYVERTPGAYFTIARWASEIEEFAIAVTKIRFPEGEEK